MKRDHPVDKDLNRERFDRLDLQGIIKRKLDDIVNKNLKPFASCCLKNFASRMRNNTLLMEPKVGTCIRPKWLVQNHLSVADMEFIMLRSALLLGARTNISGLQHLRQFTGGISSPGSFHQQPNGHQCLMTSDGPRPAAPPGCPGSTPPSSPPGSAPPPGNPGSAPPPTDPPRSAAPPSSLGSAPPLGSPGASPPTGPSGSEPPPALPPSPPRAPGAPSSSPRVATLASFLVRRHNRPRRLAHRRGSPGPSRLGLPSRQSDSPDAPPPYDPPVSTAPNREEASSSGTKGESQAASSSTTKRESVKTSSSGTKEESEEASSSITRSSSSAGAITIEPENRQNPTQRNPELGPYPAGRATPTDPPRSAAAPPPCSPVTPTPTARPGSEPSPDPSWTPRTDSSGSAASPHGGPGVPPPTGPLGSAPPTRGDCCTHCCNCSVQ